MIEAKDLRLNNWVYSPIHKKNGKVVAIEIGGRPVIDIGEKESFTTSFSGTDCIEGISLTPDILDQLDLVKDPSIGEWFFAKFNIRKENEDEFCIYMQGGVKFWFVRSVKHLHELQNAIHALTGKEIEYQQK